MKAAYRRFAHAAMITIWALSASEAAAEAGRICVLVPHFKDEYWLSVAYGIETRAAETGLTVHFFEAGGYRALTRQIEQIAACERLEPDAILIGAVSSDAPSLLSALDLAARRRPVIGLVNELHSDALMARVGVDWSEMGLKLGQHLTGLFPADGPHRRAVLLSGPGESGWVAPLESGLRMGLRGSSVSIAAVYGADTGVAEQLRILERSLADGPTPDLIVGSAPAIEAAMALYATADSAPLLAATYVSHSVARGLVGGRVAAAPYDDPMQQGSLAVDAALAAIDGITQAGLIGPPINVISAGAMPDAFRLSPVDYFPLLE